MITVLSLIFAAVAFRGELPAESTQVWVARQTFAMGTSLAVEVAATERQVGIDAIEAVFANTRRLELMLSSWTSTTEVGRINAAPVGEPTRVSAELIELLEEAEKWSTLTGGAFDPSVGALTDVWDLRGQGRQPDQAEIRSAVASTGLRHFRIDQEGGVVTRLDARAWIDTGAFGKGVALRQAREILEELGVVAGAMDFGGQLLVFGESEREGEWPIGIARPSAREETYMQLRVNSGSVSTSAQFERFVSVGDVRFGHIIDPRTGLPLEAWGSVTVVAADPVAADVLSTALLVMGPDAGLRWAEEQDEVGVLFLEEVEGGVEARWNHAFEQYQLLTTAR